MLSAFPPAIIPIPILDVTLRVLIFAVPETFARFVTTLVVVTLLETYTLPWTLSAFPPAIIPIPIFDVTERL